MAEPESQLETIFNTFDKDHSGTIELNELAEVAEALGQKIPSDQLHSIVEGLDTNGDGKISLEEFKFWWQQGHQGKLGDLVFLKAKAMKMTEGFFTHFDKAGVDLTSFDKESGVDIIDISIACGEAVEGALSVEVNLFHRGDRFKDALQGLKDRGITWLNEKAVNLMLILPSENPAKAKEELSTLLKTLTESGQFPMMEGGDENPYLSIKLEPIEKGLVLHVEIKQALMGLLSSPIKKFDSIDALFEDNFYIFLKGYFQTNFSIPELLEQDNLIETLLKGFYLQITGEAPNSVLKKFREVLEKSGESGSIKFISSLLMKSAFLKLKLKSPSMIEKFYDKIGIKDILNECPTLLDLLEQASLLPEVQELKHNQKSPQHFLYKLMGSLKVNVDSGIELYGQRGQTLVSLKTRFPEGHKLFNIVFNEV